MKTVFQSVVANLATKGYHHGVCCVLETKLSNLVTKTFRLGAGSTVTTRRKIRGGLSSNAALCPGKQ